jgi:hypothetical protein
MTSVFRQAMGSDFDRLHPELQRRFGISSAAGVACRGRGVMDRIWRGAAFTAPFLRIGSWRNILVPIHGTDVPFMIENYPYVDSLGRETVTFVRTFDLPPRRARFDATMIYSERRGTVVDYLGTHQHLAVELDLEVDQRGGLVLRSGVQRFYEGPIGFRFPLLASGVAELHEWYDDDRQEFNIEVAVTNRRFGPLFGYRGRFTCVYEPIGSGGVPASVKPLREERRD